MPASDAQIAANRQNSQRSTGPKTTEGKERSRRNALKHGLTGDGVALPDEDVAEIAARFQEIEAELQPSGVSSRVLLHRFAYLSVRLERCERLDTAVYSKRIRHAEAEFTDHRLAQVEVIASRLASDPMTTARRLQSMPEGIDLLIGQWIELKTDLNNRQRNVWNQNHRSRMQDMLGTLQTNYRISRLHALTEALGGFFQNVDPSDYENVPEQDRVEWARRQLENVIDDEINRLIDLKATFDSEAIDQDRREASARCLFDLQPAMNQVRKYEANTERNMYKALKEFHSLETRLRAEGIAQNPHGSAAELASFEPESEVEDEFQPDPSEEVPQYPLIPESIHFIGTRNLDNVARDANHPEKALC